ncbi:guided entry of tail-anchored proteins factor 1 [Tachypleus tridentatus]|uniref:guided entry of tail-anchored proteins factor 1 n=1 Tax=Tachypleus tridentatus TaxID=6853 RepID=UPI003FD1BF9D
MALIVNESASGDSNTTLFWVVTACGLIGSLVPTLVKMLVQIVVRESEMEVSLRRQVCDLKAELGSVSMIDEFAKYAKIQRKINKITEELLHQAQLRSTSTMNVGILATVVFYVILSATIVYLLLNYRHVPVIILPEEWLYPLGSILSLPSGVSGGVGLPPWLATSGSVGRLMARALS